MRTLAIVLLSGVPFLAIGCGRSTPTEQPTSRTKLTKHIQDEQKALEQHAKRVKQNIDDLIAESFGLSKEATDTLRVARQKSKTKAQETADEIAEYAAQVVEDAKDRAEDIPEEVDRVIDEQTERLKSRYRPSRRQPRDEDAESDSDR